MPLRSLVYLLLRLFSIHDLHVWNLPLALLVPTQRMGEFNRTS